MKKSIFILATAMLLLVGAALNANAQVTIGSNKTPETYSALEIINSSGSSGLRLPQMTIAQRNALIPTLTGDALAMGLQVFNTDTRCIETWNGTRWLTNCGNTTAPVGPDPILCGADDGHVDVNGHIEIPVFMAYSLGADPSLNTPKLQMSYLANNPFNDVDGRVYGGRYQWGRANLPYAISTNGTYTLYKGVTNSVSLNSLVPASYDVNGQIVGQNNNHVFVIPTILSTYDWRTGEASPVQQDNLWGNGLPFGAGNLQNPVKTVNDPCPDGFRVPTQDEWERLTNYDCDPTSAVAGTVTVPVPAGSVGNSTTGFTWVAVVCASGSCSRNNTWTSGSTQAGYAIYLTSVWENGSSWNTGNLLDPAAPEPFMFLPAAGYRGDNSGSLASVGSAGYYWSSTVNGVGARALGFTSSTVNSSSNGHRAHGFSVRCVAE